MSVAAIFIANWAIHLDGQMLDEGDLVELDRDVAESLLAGGSISPSSDAPAVEDDAPTDPDLRRIAIAGAISALDPDDDTLWTADGAPKVGATEAVLDWGITAEERDHGFKLFQNAKAEQNK